MRIDALSFTAIMVHARLAVFDAVYGISRKTPISDVRSWVKRCNLPLAELDLLQLFVLVEDGRYGSRARVRPVMGRLV